MKNKQFGGAALITVLIIIFILMAIISNITVQNYREIKRLTNQKVMEQCSAILDAAVNFGRAGLATSAATSKIDTLDDIWAQPIPKTKVVDDIDMSGYLIDEQGKFNINDLVSNGQINQTVLNQFIVLLNYLNLPDNIALSVAAYMTYPQYQDSGIAQQYTSAKLGYQLSGKPLVDISELLLVKGMRPEWVFKLSQYVSVIPQSISDLIANSNESTTQNTNTSTAPPTGTGSILVNVNTASAQVIAAKSGVPLPVAQQMTTIRHNKPFNSEQDITNFFTSNGIILSHNDANGASSTIHMGTLTTSSNYFTLHTAVDKGDYEFKRVALIYRANRSGQWPVVLWQHPE